MDVREPRVSVPVAELVGVPVEVVGLSGLLETPEPELLGYVGVVMSKRALQVMAGDILRGNFIALMSLAVLLLLLLLLITRRLLKPLDDLSNIMLRAEGGDAYVRAEIRGCIQQIEVESLEVGIQGQDHEGQV